ncbi:hypothetical protein NC652_014643 [Populus alba x Populus x berolinensis]|nr:hypothetical protein NC652_014643 [Populus alba x Populus x berolinensis]
MNEHKRWETILVHPADSKPYNKSLVKALFIIKVYDASIYIRGNHDLLPALQFFKHSCLRLPFRTLKSSSGPHMANLLPDWMCLFCSLSPNIWWNQGCTSMCLCEAWLFECWIFSYCRRLLTKYHLTAHIIKIYKIRQQTISNLAAVDRSPSFKSSCVDCKILTVVALHSANDWHVGIFAPLVAMLGPPLGPSIDMMSMASTLSSADWYTSQHSLSPLKTCKV